MILDDQFHESADKKLTNRQLSALLEMTRLPSGLREMLLAEAAHRNLEITALPIANESQKLTSKEWLSLIFLPPLFILQKFMIPIPIMAIFIIIGMKLNGKTKLYWSLTAFSFLVWTAVAIGFAYVFI